MKNADIMRELVTAEVIAQRKYDCMGMFNTAHLSEEDRQKQSVEYLMAREELYYAQAEVYREREMSNPCTITKPGSWGTANEL